MKKTIKKIVPTKFHSHLRYLQELFDPKTSWDRIKAKKIVSRENCLACVIVETSHGKYCVPESSMQRPAARLILEGFVHEEKTLSYLSKNCSGGDIIMAGTYFGDFLPTASNACDDGFLVWGFEPSPENFRYASITKELNNLKNVKLQNLALGTEKATLHLLTTDVLGRSLGGASRVVESNYRTVLKQTLSRVHRSRIDDLIPKDRQISLMQLDVEGHEISVLRGAIETIKGSLPTLILEDKMGDKQLLEDAWLIDCLLPLGYAPTGHLNGNLVLEAMGSQGLTE